MRRRRSDGSRTTLVLLLGGLGTAARLTAQASNAADVVLAAPIGARLTALGGAGVADSSPVNALFSSPAAYAHATRKDVALEYAQDDFTKRAVATLTYPVRLVGTFALNGYFQDLGQTPRVTGSGVQIGTLFHRNVEVAGTYAAGFGRGLSAGVTFKYIQFRVDCEGTCEAIAGLPLVPPTVSSTSAVDLGVQYQLPGRSPIHLGAALRNVGLKLQVVDAEQADPLPTQLAVGAAYDVPHVDRTVPGGTLSIFAEGSAGIGSETRDNTVRLGVEGGYQRTVFLRAGYAFRSGAYGGATVGFGLARNRVALDVARQVIVSDALSNNPPTYIGLRYAF